MLDIEKINGRFHRLGTGIVRFRTINLVVVGILLLVAIFGLPLVKSDTNQESYFLENDELLIAKRHFESIFGNDDFCAVLVESQDVFTPEALRLIRQMGQELKHEVPYADDVVSLTDMEFTSATEEGLNIDKLVPDPVPTDPAVLAGIRKKALEKKSLRNRIVSDDGRQTWIMVRLKTIPQGATAENGEAVDLAIGRKVKEIAARPQYASLNPKTTGLPVIDLEKRLYMGKETPKLLGISLVLMMVALALFLRNLRGVFFPLVSAVVSILLIFGLQGYLGIVHEPTVIFLPIFLGLAMAVCYSVYYVNAYRSEFAQTGLRKQSLAKSIGESGWPIGFSALTTVAALLSFCVVPLRPVRWMGVTAASLTALIYLLTIILLPSLLSFGKDRPAEKLSPPRAGILDRLVMYLGDRVLLRPKLSLGICALTFLISIIGLFRIDISFDFRESSGMKVPYVARICSIAESKVGSLYSYGIGIELPSPGDAKTPENLNKLDTLCQEIGQFPLTKKVSSLLDILKDMNQLVRSGAESEYRIPATTEEIAQVLLLYENAGGAEAERWVDYEYQRLRIQVEVDDYNSGEAARELERIRDRAKELFPGAKIVLTGSLSQFTVMQDYISWGQIKSLGLSILTICALMAIVFGSIKIGLIAMIPNIAPSLFTGAIMGYCGFPLDLMTVTVMPMLLGLAVDDTIHFINHSQLEFARTGSYAESTRRTFRVAGKAILMTSVVLGLCFSAYMISEVNVFFRLGLLVCVGALSALLADYFITPVLLQQLRVFGEEKGPSGEQANEKSASPV